MPRTVPLTFQQKWLWNVIRDNESWQCAATRAFRLSGLLSIPLLERCLQEVIESHDALRTHLVTLGAAVRQEIRDPQAYHLETVRIPGATGAQITANALRYVEDVCDRRMLISDEPLWNARLLQLGEYEHWFVLSMHRLIGDCVSIEQTYRETKARYGEKVHGRSSSLKPAAQYADYTSWQHKAAEDWLKRHEPYWKQHLTEVTALRWPVDMDLTANAPGGVGKVECYFGKALSASLMELARVLRTLPAVVMMAIYAAVLWRWCRQQDFVLPFNTAGRPTEYKSAMGYFSYALYLRVHIAGEETFSKLASRLGNEFFTSLSHQDFGRIAHQLPQFLSGTLFQWVSWYPEESAEERVGVREFGEGLTVVPLSMASLEVTVFDTETGLHAFGSYRTDQFAARTMERFMAELRWAAERFIHNHDARISAVAQSGGNADGMAERGHRPEEARPRVVPGAGATRADCGSGDL